MALSPMMQQYMEIKEKYSDCLLAFRLGDFYEFFFDDAKTVSITLELTLTGRNCGLKEKAPMCGVPHHAFDSYASRLVKAGYKLAICEQLEDPSAAKGIVERDVIRIITPGTLDVNSNSESYDNLYIASIFAAYDKIAMALSDLSTGEFFGFDFFKNDKDILSSELARYAPKEIITSDSNLDLVRRASEDAQITPYISSLDEGYYSLNACTSLVLNHFNSASLVSLGLDGRNDLICAAGSLLGYLTDTQKQPPAQIKDIEIKSLGSSMQLDRSTMRNLELLETMYEHDVRGSLFGVLNKTKTAMGARLLKSFLKEPLKESSLINKRLDAVSNLYDNPLIASDITKELSRVYDFQRLTAAIASKRANARDLIALKTTLGRLPAIVELLDGFDSELMSVIREGIDDFSELYDRIDRAIVEEPPFHISEGGLIKDGYSEELDSLKASIKDAKLWIANLEKTERERTGIKTIKVGFNKVFGYYIDVSKGMIDKVPDDYIRKQTLVNNERYITPELKEKESLVLSAETKINQIELEIFKDLRSSIEPYISSLQMASSNVALLDVLISFAKVSSENNYVKPLIDDSSIISIEAGRHPTVEQNIGSGMFVANDTLINDSDRSMLIITGPNMAGKSTYMRQTAIIVLMAQIGCFVPASKAHIGVVDRVFTRIGASDNLAYGQSTFFVEMSELANILRNASDRSLIILDEIGRGTSTYDGLSIAWATVEYLSSAANKVRTMFATHYHELTSLCKAYPSVHNLSVAVSENKNDIVFLHNIVEGPASKSYGIHVAKIAGVPSEIRKNALNKLRELEAGDNFGHMDCKQLILTDFFAPGADYKDDVDEEKDFRNEESIDFAREISTIDINTLTPIQAMNELSEVIVKAKQLLEEVEN